MVRGITSTDVLKSRYNVDPKDKYKGAIDYQGDKIAQWHNPRIFLDDLYGENQTKQFTSIMLIGTPGTGKTTTATFIGHGMHERNPNYYILHLRRDDLLKFDQRITNLPKGRDVVLIFDDVSLVFKDVLSPQQKAKILTTLTEARHPNFEETDRKVMVVVNVHYENAMEKMWRSQGSWKIYTDMSSDEAQVFNGKTKSRYSHKVDLFQYVVLSQFRKKEFTVSLTNNLKHTYVTGGTIQDNPKSPQYKVKGKFRFIMVYDTIDVRFYLVANEFCGLCSADGQKLEKTYATSKEIDQLIVNYYGKDGRAGMKLALINSGISHQFRNKVIYGYNIALELLQFFDIDKDDLADFYRSTAKIEDKRLYTTRRKKVDFFKDLIAMRSRNVSPLGNLAPTKKIKEDDIDLNL